MAACGVGSEQRARIKDVPAHMRALYRDWTYARVCVRCNTVYTELDNVGRAECRVHLGHYNTAHAGATQPRMHYECCGASRVIDDVHFDDLEPHGCFPTDHTVAVQPYEKLFGGDDGTEWLEIVAVPLLFERFMGVRLPRTNVLELISSLPDEQNVEIAYETHDGDTIRATSAEMWPRGPVFATAAAFFGADAESENWFEQSYYEHADAESERAGGESDENAFDAYYVVRRTSQARDPTRVAYFFGRGAHRIDIRSFGHTERAPDYGPPTIEGTAMGTAPENRYGAGIV